MDHFGWSSRKISESAQKIIGSHECSQPTRFNTFSEGTKQQTHSSINTVLFEILKKEVSEKFSQKQTQQRPKADGVPKNAKKPMEQFSVEEVQNWLKTFMGEKYADLAKNFAQLDGDEMMKLPKETLQKDLGNVLGDAIYNEWHPEVKGVFFNFVSYFLESEHEINYEKEDYFNLMIK